MGLESRTIFLNPGNDFLEFRESTRWKGRQEAYQLKVHLSIHASSLDYLCGPYTRVHDVGQRAPVGLPTAEMNHHCLQTAGTPSFDHARRSGSHHPGRRRRVVGAAARCKTTAMAWNRLAGHYQELQTFRTKDLSFPRTKGPYGELLFPGNESSWEVSFLGPFVPGNFRSHICVRCFITAV